MALERLHANRPDHWLAMPVHRLAPGIHHARLITGTAYDDQEGYRGGYMRTTRRVYCPAGSGGGAPVVAVSPPTGFTIDYFTSNSVSLLWTPAPNATGAIVEVAIDPNFGELVGYAESTTLDAMLVSGLTPNTEYYVRVSTLFGAFKSAPCVSQYFTTSAP